VIPDDIKRLAIPVLAHRLILSPDTRLRGYSVREALSDLIKRVAVPVEEVWEEATAA
jgi:MoxR-like ATPase